MPASSPITPSERPLALTNLTYISDCRIPVDNQAALVEALVWHARRSNAIDGITGGLLCTGARFVQTLEGTVAAVDALMTRIERDDRHTCLVVIDQREVVTRTFGQWALAYSGPSVSIARIVERALAGAKGGKPGDVNRLLQLMRQFGLSAP